MEILKEYFLFQLILRIWILNLIASIFSWSPRIVSIFNYFFFVKYLHVIRKFLLTEIKLKEASIDKKGFAPEIIFVLTFIESRDFLRCQKLYEIIKLEARYINYYDNFFDVGSKGDMQLAQETKRKQEKILSFSLMKSIKRKEKMFWKSWYVEKKIMRRLASNRSVSDREILGIMKLRLSHLEIYSSIVNKHFSLGANTQKILHEILSIYFVMDDIVDLWDDKKNGIPNSVLLKLSQYVDYKSIRQADKTELIRMIRHHGIIQKLAAFSNNMLNKIYQRDIDRNHRFLKYIISNQDIISTARTKGLLNFS